MFPKRLGEGDGISRIYGFTMLKKKYLKIYRKKLCFVSLESDERICQKRTYRKEK